MEEVRYPYHSPVGQFVLDAVGVAKWSVRKVSGMGRQCLPDIIKRRVIASYARSYGLNTFVESGTYLGGTVAYMRKYCRQVYSVEFQPHLATAAQKRFADDPSIRIIQGSGAVLMPQIVAELNGPALFWLDGHFASGTTRPGEVACPTMEEMSAVLADSRYAHVILVDDADDFKGEGGYPTIAEMRKAVLAERPAAAVEVRDNIVRVTPVDLSRSVLMP